MNIQERKIITLTDTDMNESSKDKPLDELGVYDFLCNESLNMKMVNQAWFISYRDERGYVILKNKVPFSAGTYKLD